MFTLSSSKELKKWLIGVLQGEDILPQVIRKQNRNERLRNRKNKKVVDKHLKFCYNIYVNDKRINFLRKRCLIMANTITRKSVLTKAMEIELFSKEEKDVIKKMIDSLDHKSSKPTKAQTENLAIKVQIAEILTQPMTAREIADALGISTNKVASLLRQMDVEKIKGEKSKDAPKYALLASTDVEADEE